jgi:hypothetical protein
LTFQEILNLWRARLDDEKGPDAKRLWKDWEGAVFASDAEREIARELLVLDDADTIGYLTVSGSAGQIDSVAVSGAEITSGAVVFSSNLQTTALNLASNINAHTFVSNYRAVALGRRVVIRATPGTYPASGYALSSSASGGMTVSCENLPGLCRHIVAANQRYIQLHEKIIRVHRFKPSTQTRPIAVLSTEQMDSSQSDWEKETSANAIRVAVANYDRGELILHPARNAAECIEQGVYRYPLFDFDANELWAVPEVHSRYHIAIVDWMLRQSFLKQDSETLDIERSNKFEAEFNRRIENFKRENNRARPARQYNQTPGGLL